MQRSKQNRPETPARHGLDGRYLLTWAQAEWVACWLREGEGMLDGCADEKLALYQVQVGSAATEFHDTTYCGARACGEAARFGWVSG